MISVPNTNGWGFLLSNLKWNIEKIFCPKVQNILWYLANNFRKVEISCKVQLSRNKLFCIMLDYIISLIPRMSHRLEYFTFRTISWSWNSSPNYFMARALRVHFHHNTHESYVCRAKCRVCGTLISELGQWIRINIGRARLKRNLDLISVFHCHCPRAQLLAAHTAARQS